MPRNQTSNMLYLMTNCYDTGRFDLWKQWWLPVWMSESGESLKTTTSKWVNISNSCNNIGFKSNVVQSEKNYEYHCLSKPSKLHIKSSLDPKHHYSKPITLFLCINQFWRQNPDPEGNLRPCQIWFNHNLRQWDLIETCSRPEQTQIKLNTERTTTLAASRCGTNSEAATAIVWITQRSHLSSGEDIVLPNDLC